MRSSKNSKCNYKHFSRVITGARFRIRRTIHENDDELYIEIQEGQMLVTGGINASTLAWKHPVNQHSPEEYEDSFMVFSDKERFYLFAQDLSDFNHDGLPMVLTGLQFQKSGYGVSLKIHGSKVSIVNASTLNHASVFITKPYEPNYFVAPIVPENRRDNYHYNRFIRDNENSDDKLKEFLTSIDHK